jgi:hypothetical protein
MGRVACIGEKRNACRIFMQKPKGNRPLGGPRRVWECNTEADLKKIEYA